MRKAGSRLPSEILSRASKRGKELAWRLEDIPDVIEAARRANLVNVGGQLQFRIPEGGTCECYWVEVDTYKSVPKKLPWNERVEKTAKAALSDFEALKTKYDFVAEGRKAFRKDLDDFVARGTDLSEAMCFVWYVKERE